jgi:FkbM family methyltransferase
MSAREHPLYIGFYKYLYWPKKDSLAQILDTYSRNTTNLTVIQVGANDGFNHDPIVKFIKRDKWNGVLLEPQKYVHDTFLSKLYENNNNLHTLNAALDYKDGERSLYNIAFSKARWATGLSSFDKAALDEAIVSGHVARNAAKEGITLPSNRENYISEEKIKVISPPTLMRQYNISKIDLLQIDAEGFDYEIIKMMDIPHTKPGMIIFEDSHLSESALIECHNLLRDNDYTLKKTLGNTVAIKNHLLEKIA